MYRKISIIQDSEMTLELMSIIEAGGSKVNEMTVLGGIKGRSIFDFTPFDELANIQSEVHSAPKITYGPERKGKKGKLKRW